LTGHYLRKKSQIVVVMNAEQEFNVFSLTGISWNQLGNAERSDLDAYMQEHNFNSSQRLQLVDLWKRHPEYIRTHQLAGAAQLVVNAEAGRFCLGYSS
jgi:hypothetical protein